MPTISTLGIGIFYLSNITSGTMRSRGLISLERISYNLEGIFRRIPEFFEDLIVYAKESINNISENFGFNLATLLIILGVLALRYYIYKKDLLDKKEKTFNIKKLSFGLIFTIAPLLPFLILANMYIEKRNMYMVNFGVAILVEMIIDFVLKLVKPEKIREAITDALVTVILIVFVIININCLNEYKRVYEFDNKIGTQILENLPEESFSLEKSISINYNEDDMKKQKDTVQDVYAIIELDWAVQGKLQVLRNKVGTGKVFINSKTDEADYVLYFDKNMNIMK